MENDGEVRERERVNVNAGVSWITDLVVFSQRNSPKKRPNTIHSVHRNHLGAPWPEVTYRGTHNLLVLLVWDCRSRVNHRWWWLFRQGSNIWTLKVLPIVDRGHCNRTPLTGYSPRHRYMHRKTRPLSLTFGCCNLRERCPTTIRSSRCLPVRLKQQRSFAKLSFFKSERNPNRGEAMASSQSAFGL